MLSQLQETALPTFGRPNWKSTIRHLVADQPDYAELGRITGPETADIVYTDFGGTFTDFLIEKGYLPATAPRMGIQYAVEVKTTTDTCETPFYMSNAQYNLVYIPSSSQSRAVLTFISK